MTKEFSTTRRNFLKGASMGAVAVAGMAGLARLCTADQG